MSTQARSTLTRGSHTQVCADCSAPDASWASLNRGVLICDECCSVHRILGRHISQIKSLKKSPWAPSQLTMVTALYAKGANLLWEHALFHPGNSSPGIMLGKTNRRKPSPKDPIHPNKSEFIRAKYQLQSFIHRPAKDEPQCSCDDLSQQLHSSVRTSNIEISLRLLCLGADPNYWHPEKGNRPLHVAAKAGQWSQVELLVVYSADPGTPDIAGKTPSDHARSAGYPEMADRLMECQYELSDRLAYFLCNRKPDHATGQHFIIPELTLERSSNFVQLAKSARRHVQGLSNSLFESLAMDIYDEVDRQETDSIWQAGQGPTITSDRHITAFLPVNPKLSAVHNQARQKLARLHPGELAALIVDVLAEIRRRQTGIERSPTLEAVSSESPTSRSNTVMAHYSTEETSTVVSNEDDREPLYDTVAADDDYVDAGDQGVFGNGKNGKSSVSTNGNGGSSSSQCVCQREDSSLPLDQPCQVCENVVTSGQYFEMKRALEEAVEGQTRLASTVYAMQENLNRLLLSQDKVMTVSDKLPPLAGSSTGRHAHMTPVEPSFAKSLRDDSGIQEGHDDMPSGLDGQQNHKVDDRQSEGVSLPSFELLNAKASVITQSIHELKNAAEAYDTVTFKACTERIQNGVLDLEDLFQPSQFKFPVVLAKALSDLKQNATKLSTDCSDYVASMPTSPSHATPPGRVLTKEAETKRREATQMVYNDAYNVALCLKFVIEKHSAHLTHSSS